MISSFNFNHISRSNTPKDINGKTSVNFLSLYFVNVHSLFHSDTWYTPDRSWIITAAVSGVRQKKLRLTQLMRPQSGPTISIRPELLICRPNAGGKEGLTRSVTCNRLPLWIRRSRNQAENKNQWIKTWKEEWCAPILPSHLPVSWVINLCLSRKNNWCIDME